MHCPAWDDAFVTDRMPRSGKLPLLNLLKAKNQVFWPTGAIHCTNSGQTWRGRRAPGSAWLCKISPQSAQGVGMRPPKYQKFPLFGKELPRRCDPLDRFVKIFGFFLYAQLPCSVFQIWPDSLHRLRSYCWETARRLIRPNFSVHPVGKTIRWIEKWIDLFWWPRPALSPCKV